MGDTPKPPLAGGPPPQPPNNGGSSAGVAGSAAASSQSDGAAAWQQRWDVVLAGARQEGRVVMAVQFTVSARTGPAPRTRASMTSAAKSLVVCM